MNQGLKQRLVGTLVLLALAVILAPVLFNFDERPTIDSVSQVPPAPAIEPVAFPEPQRPDGIPERDESELFWPGEPVGAPAPEPAPGASSGNTPETPVATRMDPVAVPADAWVIQVGTFGERARAEALLKTLIDDGYKAYQRSQFRNGTELHLLFVGPVLSRAEADRQQRAIEREYGLDVLIRRFSP